MGDGCIVDNDPDGGLALPCSCAERTDGDRPVVVTCGECGKRWCERCQPTHGPRCHFEGEHADMTDPHHALVRSGETGQMYAREALYMALRALRPDMEDPDPEQARRAAEVLQMLVDQRGCGEVGPGDGYLTHAMDAAVFG